MFTVKILLYTLGLNLTMNCMFGLFLFFIVCPMMLKLWPIFELNLISCPITLFNLDSLLKIHLSEAWYYVRFCYLVVDLNHDTPLWKTHPTMAYLELWWPKTGCLLLILRPTLTNQQIRTWHKTGCLTQQDCAYTLVYASVIFFFFQNSRNVVKLSHHEVHLIHIL